MSEVAPRDAFSVSVCKCSMTYYCQAELMSDCSMYVYCGTKGKLRCRLTSAFVVVECIQSVQTASVDDLGHFPVGCRDRATADIMPEQLHARISTRRRQFRK